MKRQKGYYDFNLGGFFITLIIIGLVVGFCIGELFDYISNHLSILVNWK